MIQDSGERRRFDGGGVRDMCRGKGRYDLLPMFALDAVAKLMEAGAEKYGDRNWEQGIPNSSFVDSAFRHLNKFVREEYDEPHLVQAAWNLLCAIDQQERIKLGRLDPKFDNIGVKVESPKEDYAPRFIESEAVAPIEQTAHELCPNFIEEDCRGESVCVDCDLNHPNGGVLE